MSLDSSVLADHRHRIYDFAVRFLGCREDAADVTQEVLVRLWQRGEQIDPARRKAWVLKVTRNACLDLLRKNKTRQAYTPATPSIDDFAHDAPTPDRLAESSDFRVFLEHAIEQLDEPYRSLVVLREIHGLSYKELAETLDLPLSTTKVYLHRARKRLRSTLRQTIPAEELTL